MSEGDGYTISDDTIKVFEVISDPANSHLFTVQSALALFKRSFNKE